jgi:hypothetical protein
MVLVMFVLLKTSLYHYISLPFANGEAICGDDKETGDIDGRRIELVFQNKEYCWFLSI